MGRYLAATCRAAVDGATPSPGAPQGHYLDPCTRCFPVSLLAPLEATASTPPVHWAHTRWYVPVRQPAPLPAIWGLRRTLQDTWLSIQGVLDVSTPLVGMCFLSLVLPLTPKHVDAQTRPHELLTTPPLVAAAHSLLPGPMSAVSTDGSCSNCTCTASQLAGGSNA